MFDPAAADRIDYGSITGDTVVFSQIVETSSTTDGPVYGSPFGFEDTMSFVPFGFQATSFGTLDFEEGRLSFTVTANEGFVIESMELMQASSFLLFGDEAMVMSNLFGVVNADGHLFTASSSIEMRQDNFNNQNSFVTDLKIELPAVQEATVVLDSQILAAAFGPDALASISTDALLIRINTRSAAAIPEPTAAALVPLILATCWCRRRKSRTAHNQNSTGAKVVKQPLA